MICVEHYKLLVYSNKACTTFAARFLAVFTMLGGFWGLQETHVYLHLAQEGVTRQSIGLSQAAATLAGAGFIS